MLVRFICFDFPDVFITTQLWILFLYCRCYWFNFFVWTKSWHKSCLSQFFIQKCWQRITCSGFFHLSDTPSLKLYLEYRITKTKFPSIRLFHLNVCEYWVVVCIISFQCNCFTYCGVWGFWSYVTTYHRITLFFQTFFFN